MHTDSMCSLSQLHQDIHPLVDLLSIKIQHLRLVSKPGEDTFDKKVWRFIDIFIILFLHFCRLIQGEETMESNQLEKEALEAFCWIDEIKLWGIVNATAEGDLITLLLETLG
jgi:hypothetical protein